MGGHQRASLDRERTNLGMLLIEIDLFVSLLFYAFMILQNIP